MMTISQKHLEQHKLCVEILTKINNIKIQRKQLEAKSLEYEFSQLPYRLKQMHINGCIENLCALDKSRDKLLLQYADILQSIVEPILNPILCK